MADITPIQIPYSFVEYKGLFSEPIFAAFVRKDWAVTRAVYGALQKWGLSLEQIVLRQSPANVSEIQVTFNLPRVGIAVHLSMGNLTIFMNSPDWSRAAELVEVATAAVEATKVGAGASFQTQQLSLGIHLIPRGKTHKEFTSRFVGVDEKSVNFLGKIKGSGFSLYAENASVVVDASGLNPEAFFVRITRSHDGNTTVAQMAQMLERDEKQTFAFLGVHEDV